MKESDSTLAEPPTERDRGEASRTGSAGLKLLVVLCVALLLAGGAYIGWRIGLSGKMLLQAVDDLNEERAERLIRWGARVDARDAKDRTSLHIAADSMQWLVCDALIDAGADVNAVDIDGNTPAHFAIREAVMGGYDILFIEDFLSSFVETGADFEAKNKKGARPIDPLLDELAIARMHLDSVSVFGYRKGTPREEIERRRNDPKRLAQIAEAEQRVKELERVVNMVLRSDSANQETEE